MTSQHSEGHQKIYQLTPELIAEVKTAIASENYAEVRSLVCPLLAPDIADLFKQLSFDLRGSVITALGDEFAPEILTYLEDDLQEEVMEVLGKKKFAGLLPGLESDDVVELIEELDDEEREEIFKYIPARDRLVLEQSLTYPEDSAGRIMQREIVTVPEHWNVGQAIDIFRLNVDLPNDFYDIFIVNPKHNVAGVLALSRLLRSHRSTSLQDIMQTNYRAINVETDQEEVAQLFRKYGLVSAPVIDAEERLVGVITVDDVVDIIDEEAEEDILYLAGVTEQDTRSAVWATARLRLPWLIVNLGLAFTASWVVSLFRGTLDQYVALAVLMMIVPSLSGNAATQTMTVVIRALAMRELSRIGARKLIVKEAFIGVLNGLFFAALTGIVAGFWFHNLILGIVIGFAMIGNLIIAAIVGVTIPMFLSRTSIDPAIASSIFVTILTDVCGFFLFLGLATLFLL
jgi:magnesium transporter